MVPLGFWRKNKIGNKKFRKYYVKKESSLKKRGCVTTIISITFCHSERSEESLSSIYIKRVNSSLRSE